MKTLIIDDSKTQRLILRRLLNELEILEVEETPSAEDAMSVVGDEEFELILLDIHMPGINGLEFFEQLRKDESSANQNTPVVIVSSDASSTYIDRARDLGAAGYVMKPFSVDVLARAIKQAHPRSAPDA